MRKAIAALVLVVTAFGVIPAMLAINPVIWPTSAKTTFLVR